MSDRKELAARLRQKARGERNSVGDLWGDHICEEAADALDAPAPPADVGVTRYQIRPTLFCGVPSYRFDARGDGEWVRYEDHAAALAEAVAYQGKLVAALNEEATGAEAAEAEIARLREALKPFAKAADEYERRWTDIGCQTENLRDDEPLSIIDRLGDQWDIGTLGDLRCARAILSTTGRGADG